MKTLTAEEQRELIFPPFFIQTEGPSQWAGLTVRGGFDLGEPTGVAGGEDDGQEKELASADGFQIETVRDAA